MIRYALILVVATVVLGLTGAALDGASTTRGEQAIETEIAAVDSAATSLFQRDATVSRAGTSRRVVEIDLPDETRTREGTTLLRFERIRGADKTRVTYRASGGVNRTKLIDAPIRSPGGGPVVLDDLRGRQRLVLELSADSEGSPVVVVSEYGVARSGDTEV